MSLFILSRARSTNKSITNSQTSILVNKCSDVPWINNDTANPTIQDITKVSIQAILDIFNETTFVTFYIFGNTLFLLLSFRKETLDLPAQSRYPPPLPRVGPTWLVAHGVIHSLGDLYLHLLVCLVWPQSLTLDADHPLPGPGLCPRLRCPP